MIVRSGIVGNGSKADQEPLSQVGIGTKLPFTSFATIGQQIEIKSNLANKGNEPQKFSYVVQILNGTDRTVDLLSWVSGMLPGEGLQQSAAVGWRPEMPGNYIAEIFTLDNIDGSYGISPPAPKQTLEFTVANSSSKT